MALDSGGKLVYAQAENGDRIVDFSHCGYVGGDETIPDVPVRVVVSPRQGDATARIQAAIDFVAALPASDDRGIRGAVLLRFLLRCVTEDVKVVKLGHRSYGRGCHRCPTVFRPSRSVPAG